MEYSNEYYIITVTFLGTRNASEANFDKTKVIELSMFKRKKVHLSNFLIHALTHEVINLCQL